MKDNNAYYGQSGEDAVLLRLFKNVKNGFYIDVGAFHPTKYSNTHLLHQKYGWYGINIDASKDTIKQFKKERPNDININSGVGIQEEEATFHIFDNPAINTFSYANLARQEKKGKVILKKERVRVSPLKDILDEYEDKIPQIDLMSIDIEGFDLDALRSNDWEKYRPRVILVEDYSVLEGSLTKSPIYKYLNKQDYIFISHAFDTSFYAEKNFVKHYQDEGYERAALKKALKKVQHNAGRSEVKYSQMINSRSWQYITKIKKILNKLKRALS